MSALFSSSALDALVPPVFLQAKSRGVHPSLVLARALFQLRHGHGNMAFPTGCQEGTGLGVYLRSSLVNKNYNLRHHYVEGALECALALRDELLSHLVTLDRSGRPSINF